MKTLCIFKLFILQVYGILSTKYLDQEEKKFLEAIRNYINVRRIRNLSLAEWKSVIMLRVRQQVTTTRRSNQKIIFNFRTTATFLSRQKKFKKGSLTASLPFFSF